MHPTKFKISDWIFTVSNKAFRPDEFVKLYPNPVSEFFVIECEEPVRNLIIYDNYGKILEEINPNNKKLIQLNVQNYKQGSYFVKITTDKNEKTAKLIIRR